MSSSESSPCSSKYESETASESNEEDVSGSASGPEEDSISSSEHDDDSLSSDESESEATQPAARAGTASQRLPRPKTAHPSRSHPKNVQRDLDILSTPSSSSQRTERPLSNSAQRMTAATAVYGRTLTGLGSVKVTTPSRKTAATRLFKEGPAVHSLTVHKNGSLTPGGEVLASNLVTLLQESTRKLDLPFAARRAFNSAGKEILSDEDVQSVGQSDSVLFISIGEGYRDPITSATRRKSIKTTPRTPSGRTPQKQRSLTVDTARLRVLLFQNGRAKDPVSVVYRNIEQFKDDTATRLSLPSKAKRFFTIDGTELADPSEAQVDASLTLVLGNVLGPLWVSIGEAYCPDGALAFLQEVRQRLKRRLAYVKQYVAALDAGHAVPKSDDAQPLPYLASFAQPDKMTGDELTAHTEELKKCLAAIKQSTETCKNLAGELESETYDHIPKIDDDHRLLTKSGLRLRVFLNGKGDSDSKGKTVYFNIREAARGVEVAVNGTKLVLEQLLDACTKRLQPPSGKTGRILFRDDGSEVKSVKELQRDERLWLSCGEPFEDFQRYSIDLVLECVQSDGKSGFVSTSRTVPLSILKSGFSEVEKKTSSEADTSNTESKDSKNATSSANLLQTNDGTIVSPVVLVAAAQKGQGSNEWLLVRSASNPAAVLICNKAAQQLVLAVSADKSAAPRLLVSMRAAQETAEQLWIFSTCGQIQPATHPHLVLTMHNPAAGLSAGVASVIDDASTGSIKLLLAPVQSSKEAAKWQRWGIKQSSFASLGQWKLGETADTTFKKSALLWPVNAAGALNTDLTWPVDGCLVAGAPWAGPTKPSTLPAPVTARSILVLRRGESNMTLAKSILLPEHPSFFNTHASSDAAATSKENSASGTKSGSKTPTKTPTKPVTPKSAGSSSSSKSPTPATLSSTQEYPLDTERWFERRFGPDWRNTVAANKQKPDLLAVQMEKFLDLCTQVLNLPAAARSVYTKDMQKLETLQSVKAGDLLIISCKATAEALEEPDSSRWSGTNTTSLVKKTVKANVFRNGSIHNPVTIIAPLHGNPTKPADSQMTYDILSMLNSAQDRLHLSSVARCFYSRSGKLIKTLADLEAIYEGSNPPNVWVTCGELFVSPECIPEELAKEARQLTRTLEKTQAALEKAKINLKQAKSSDEEYTIQCDIDSKTEQAEKLKREIATVTERQKTSHALRPLPPSAQQLAKPVTALKRVLARRNGDYIHEPETCWGKDLNDLLDNCARHLKMTQGRRMFTEAGVPITSFDAISSEQVVVVSSGESFAPKKKGTDPLKVSANATHTKDRLAKSPISAS